MARKKSQETILRIHAAAHDWARGVPFRSMNSDAPDSLEERHGESLIANCRKRDKYKPLFDEAKLIYQVGFSILGMEPRRKFDDEFIEKSPGNSPIPWPSQEELAEYKARGEPHPSLFVEMIPVILTKIPKKRSRKK